MRARRWIGGSLPGSSRFSSQLTLIPPPMDQGVLVSTGTQTSCHVDLQGNIKGKSSREMGNPQTWKL
jgi:hypothetical protein